MTISLTSDPEVNDFPRLSRFYGLSFTDLVYMPRWARHLYVSAIDHLEAEENLAALQIADYPHVAEKDRKRIHRDLKDRLTRASTGAAAPAPPAAPQLDMITRPEEARQKLGGIGIAVVMEPSPEKKEEVSADA